MCRNEETMESKHDRKSDQYGSEHEDFEIQDKNGTSAKSKKPLLIGAVALVVIIVAAAIAYAALTSNANTPSVQPVEQTSAEQSVSSNNPSANASNAQSAILAPDITVVNQNDESVTLSSLFGKPIILNFWASTCGPCQREMPYFQDAFEEYGSEIEFVMVDIPGFLGETKGRAVSFLDTNGYTFPVYFDEDSSATIAYGLNSIPRTFFIDRDGYIVSSQYGSISEATLAYGIQSLSDDQD